MTAAPLWKEPNVGETDSERLTGVYGRPIGAVRQWTQVQSFSQEGIKFLTPFVPTVTGIPPGVWLLFPPMGENLGMQDGLLSAALEIAQQRAAIQRKMKQAILDDDLETVLVCAGKLCGVDATGIRRVSPQE